MRLQPGTNLGPYQIDAPLGAGGMGEVYNATDTRLDRTVAIKVLPEHVAADPDLKQRFEREARTVAALNHPHICTLHDIGTQDGIDFLVMEYLDGETLAQRLEKGALPLDQALTIAIEIADALDKAHRQGIVHRDLKPGNIMLTKAGAKLLDFGLAKLNPQHGTPVGVSAPTMSAGLTGEGAILGTLQYMAPEQLEGKEADARTDIFSFGAVLYEMVTGQRAFQGESQASLIASILDREPVSMAVSQVLTPLSLQQLVTTCLEKDDDKRWQAIGDVARQLGWIVGALEMATPRSEDSPSPRGRATRLVLASGILGALVGAAGLWIALDVQPPLHQPPSRLSINLADERFVRMSGSPMSFVAISADGARVVYRGAGGQLFRRDLDEAESVAIPGARGGQPFFSPDGEWVAFFAGDSLRKVPLGGGEPVTLAEGLVNARWWFGTWGDGDTIIIGSDKGGLRQVSADGGEVGVLTSPDVENGERPHTIPQFLPGGRAVLYCAGIEGVRPLVAALDLETGSTHVVVDGARWARYIASGHIVYSLDDVLMIAPFDAKSSRLTGPAVPVVEQVATDENGIVVQMAASENGTMVYLRPRLVERSLVSVDLQGEAVPLNTTRQLYRYPRLSPDGRQIAVSVQNGSDRQIHVFDTIRETLVPLTYEGNNQSPIWAPDGSVTYFSIGPDSSGLYSQAVGSGQERELLLEADRGSDRYSPGSWSPDGKHLVYTSQDPDGEDVWVLTIGGDPEANRFANTPFAETQPRFSPDGRWIAYRSNESGRSEVYVKPYPGPGRAQLVSTRGAEEPVWAPDGRRLFYREGQRIMALEMSPRSDPGVGLPVVVFEGDYVEGSNTGVNFDVFPEGGRFLTLQDNGDWLSATELIVVQGWFEKLERLAPTP